MTDLLETGEAEHEVDEEEEEDKDSSLHCLNFSAIPTIPNSISWSNDGRIAVITENCLYVMSISQTPQVRRVGSPFGLQLGTMHVKNPDPVSYDVEIRANSFPDVSEFSLMDRQKFLLDRSTILRKENLSLPHNYCQVKWSPTGCTSDGRCILATLSTDGNVYIQIEQERIGKWKVLLDVTQVLHQYLLHNDWLGNENFPKTNHSKEKHLKSKTRKRKHFQVPTPDNLKNIDKTLESNEELHTYCHRKHMLFTQTICWYPLSMKCSQCLPDSNLMLNLSYANYCDAYVLCPHKTLFFLTASKSGDIFIWNLELNIRDSTINCSLLHKLHCGEMYPVSLSCCQFSACEGLVAVGLANGQVKVFKLLFTEENGSFSCEMVQQLDVWQDSDEISVSFTEWVLPKDCVMRLVITKGSEIMVFKVLKCNMLNKLVCSSCEIAPSCHSTPITSLQCVSNKYLVTASTSATQHFDIENESLPFCDKSILRGFKCYGISSEPNLCMLARVSSPNRLLLSQPAFIKQMEISFLPFLPCESIASKLLEGSISLDMAIREYFLLVSADDFLLPNILHKYCDEPASYENITMNELKLYYCFNWVRFQQQTGTSVADAVNRGVDKHVLNEDPVMLKIDRKIQLLYYEELLRKSILLFQHGWVKKSEEDLLSLLLMADWLVLNGESQSYELPLSCYKLLNDQSSSILLTAIIENKKRDVNEKNLTVIKTEAENTDDMAIKKNDIDCENSIQTKPENKDGGSNNFTILPNSDKTIKTETAIAPENESSEKLVKWTIQREKCLFCGVPISLDQPKCKNGHAVNRCALSLHSFNSRASRRCCVCHRKVRLKRFDNFELTVDSVLLNIDFCPFCDGRLMKEVT